MTKTKRIVRNIIFSQITLIILLFDVVGVSLVGCCTATVLNSEFGSSTSYFDSPRYSLSTDRGEVIVTGTRIINYHYLPPPGNRRPDTVWSRRSSWKERIPLAPVPEGMMRFRLTVEQDPDAQRYWHENVIPSDRFDVEVGTLPLRADETLHLRVRPNDLYLLSQPFRVYLIPKDDDSAGTKPEGELRLVIPVAMDGNTYELLTVAPGPPRPNPYREWAKELFRQEQKERQERKEQIPSYFRFCRELLHKIGSSSNHSAMLEQAAKEWEWHEESRYLYPFRDGMDEARMTEYERIAGDRFPSFGAVLWKALWLPPAVVIDTVLLPVYVVWSGVMYFGVLAFQSAIQ